MKVKDLKANPLNPRKITDQKLRMLSKSMKEFGDLSGIVFNRRTGQLIGGHQRIKHLDPEWEIVKKKSQDSVGTVAVGYIITPKGNWTYREVDWLEKKELAANIAANQHGGDFDIPALKTLALQVDDLDLIGFSESELFEEPLKMEERELIPYVKTHVLLSFPPARLIQIQKYLEKIQTIEGVEIEQSSN